MPTIEQLTVQFDAAFAAGMKDGSDAVEKFAASLEKASASASITDQVITKATRSIDSIAKGLVGASAEAARTEAANRKYEASLAAIQAAEARAGGATADTTLLRQRAEAQLQQSIAAAKTYGDTIEQKFNPATLSSGKSIEQMVVSAGNAAFAMRQLGVQSVQAISGIATGQSVMQVLIQQGHQVADVALSTGTGFGILGEAAKKAFDLITSPTALVVAASAAIVGLGAAAESADRRLVAMQTSLRATRDDFLSMGAEAVAAGKAVAASSVFGRSDATAAAGTIAASPNFAGTKAQLVDLVKIAGDVATVLGVSLPDEAKVFAQALGDAGKVAQDFADRHLFGFNQELARSIDLQGKAGDRAGSFGRTIDQLAKATSGAALDALTPFGKSVNALELAFTGGGQAGQGLAEKLGRPIVDMATGFVHSITDMVTVIERVVTAAQSMPPWVIEAAKAAQTAGGALLNPLGTAASAIVSRLPGTPGMPVTGNIPTDVSNEIYATAERIGIRAELADFATRIAQVESGGHQLNASGGVLTSSAGAMGIMQVMPGSAPAGLNIADRAQNIEAGLRILMDLDTRFGGDLSKIAVGYNAGPGRVGAATLPSETVAYLGKLGLTSPAPGVQFGPPVAADTHGAANATTPDEALKLANSVSAYQQAHEEAVKYQGALDALKTSGKGTAEQIAGLTFALDAAHKAEYDAIGPAAQAARAIDQQTDAAKRLGDSYAGGYAAVAQATVGNQAYQDALKFAIPGNQLFGDTVAALTSRYHDLAAQQQDNQLKAKSVDNQQQIDYLKLEVSTLGESADVRDRILAVTKAQQEIDKSQPFASPETKARILGETAAITDLNTQLKSNQQALNDIAGLATNAFDQVSNAIVQATVTGSGAAINMGNVWRGVLTSIAEGMLKIALINPLANSINGGSATTLGSIFSAVGGGSDQVLKDPSGNVIGTLGNAGSALSGGSSLLQAFGFKGIGEQLGLTGPGGLLSGLGGGSGGGILGLLNTPLWGSSASDLASIVAGAGQIPAGGIAAMGPTLGSLLGGAGAGFGLGSLGGSLIQGLLNKTGPAPTVGAGIGALGGVAAAALAPETLGLSLLAGGALGGMSSRDFGGLIKGKQNDRVRNGFSKRPIDDRGRHARLYARSRRVPPLGIYRQDVAAA